MKPALILVVLAFLLVAGCAPGPNQLANSPGPRGAAAGFWLGLWNGAISPVTFVISLFNHNVRMYEVHNNGNWYDLGFLLGISCVFGGGAGGGARARRSRG